MYHKIHSLKKKIHSFQGYNSAVLKLTKLKKKKKQLTKLYNHHHHVISEHFITPKVKVKVTQSCLTLCDPMDYTVHGILQARTLKWVAFPFSRGSSQPMDRTQVSHIAGGFSTSITPKETAYSLAVTPLFSSPHPLANTNLPSVS